MNNTTIAISFDTKQRLSNLGSKGMTYDQILNELLKQ